MSPIANMIGNSVVAGGADSDTLVPNNFEDLGGDNLLFLDGSYWLLLSA